MLRSIIKRKMIANHEFIVVPKYPFLYEKKLYIKNNKIIPHDEYIIGSYQIENIVKSGNMVYFEPSINKILMPINNQLNKNIKLNNNNIQNERLFSLQYNSSKNIIHSLDIDDSTCLFDSLIKSENRYNKNIIIDVVKLFNLHNHGLFWNIKRDNTELKTLLNIPINICLVNTLSNVVLHRLSTNSKYLPFISDDQQFCSNKIETLKPCYDLVEYKDELFDIKNTKK